MDGPIQNDYPNVLHGWPHTECFSIQNDYPHTKWMAPYRMFFHTHYMVAPYRMIFHTY